MQIYNNWLLTPERAAVHLPTATAVVADLHLGYDRVRCRQGEALPEFGLDETIATLGALADREGIRRLVIAGDLFEDGRHHTAAPAFLTWLAGMGIELLGVVPGNHDKGLCQLSPSVAVYPDGLEVDGWQVLHGDSDLPQGRVIHGHIHPCLRWSTGVVAPCYLVSSKRLVLPAFSQDAAGVNVLNDTCWHSFHCCIPVKGQVLDFGEVAVLHKKRSRTRHSQST
jgi:putative SbcD/Mre11-related phosphoesterase